MSLISTTITHGITLGTSGAYASPLTITSTGEVTLSGAGDAIYGPNSFPPTAWAVVNSGLIRGSTAVYLSGIGGDTVTNSGTIDGTGTGLNAGVELAGGSVANAGLIEGPAYGVLIAHLPGTVTNTGTILGTSAYGVKLAVGGSVGNAGLIAGTGTTGVGVSLSGATLTNAGTIIGAGGPAVQGTRYGYDTVSNSGIIEATGSSGAGIVLQQGGTIIDSGTISGASGTAISFGGTGSYNLLVLEHGYKLVGSVQGSGTVGAANTLEISGSLGAVAVNYNGLTLTNFQDVLFGAGSNETLQVTNTSGTLPVTISGFGRVSDVIDLTAIGTNGTITNNDTVNHQLTIAGSSGTLTLQLDASDGSTFTTVSDGASGTDVIPCFCRGTLILTDKGEVPVEVLAVGDRVVTLSGAPKPIRWIGFGRDLVTGKNSRARPIIVRAGALADDVPRRDLYLTHGHALYFGGVLVPVEHLVNHRSILWDESARIVEYYHIELEDHDVVFADGASAESYYAADNRALFQNTREGSAAGGNKPTCAPVLTIGDVVERAWAGLFERAGGRIPRETTDDPDLHLVVGGARLDPLAVADGLYTFTLAAPPSGPLLLASRSGVPSLLGLGRHDHRPLGVGIRQIIVQQQGAMTWFDHDAPLLRQGGCHPPECGHSWTDGQLALPASLFTHLTGEITLIVQTSKQTMRYPIAAAVAKAA